jgi:hypothetical protein
MAHYTLDGASLSELQFDIVYDGIRVSLMLVTRVLYGPLMLYVVSNFFGVWTIYLCVTQCMDYVLDNLCCSNSKNSCLPMFLPILYVLFYPFSSMLQIVHVQSVYNINKPVIIVGTLQTGYPRIQASSQDK